jgi:DNA-binding NarL/FixJ family response regulator
VCHIDDNGENNRLDNLFIGTPADNVHDAIQKGRLDNSEEKNGMAKLSNQDVSDILYLISIGKKSIDISKKFGICKDTVSKIKHGRTRRKCFIDSLK